MHAVQQEPANRFEVIEAAGHAVQQTGFEKPVDAGHAEPEAAAPQLDQDADAVHAELLAWTANFEFAAADAAVAAEQQASVAHFALTAAAAAECAAGPKSGVVAEQKAGGLRQGDYASSPAVLLLCPGMLVLPAVGPFAALKTPHACELQSLFAVDPTAEQVKLTAFVAPAAVAAAAAAGQ